LQKKLGIVATESEIDEFFKVGKTDSKDTDHNVLTAVEYIMNVHAYPVNPKLSSSLAAKIADFKPETIIEIKDWVKRLNEVIQAIKRANVR